MSKRLVKVAKELNVGTKTIVEFLNGRGFEVSNKPTAKISDEMYQLLAENFKGSVALKEKANQISIGARKKEEAQKPLKSWEVPTTQPVEEEPVAKEEPKVDEEGLNIDGYDVVLYGTGLTQSILASALTRAGKSILHCDGNDFYGEKDAVFSLGSLMEWTKLKQKAVDDRTSNATTTTTTSSSDESTDGELLKSMLVKDKGSISSIQIHSETKVDSMYNLEKDVDVVTPYGQGTIVSLPSANDNEDSYSSLAVELKHWTLANGKSPIAYFGYHHEKRSSATGTSTRTDPTDNIISKYYAQSHDIIPLKQFQFQNFILTKKRSFALDLTPGLLYANGNEVRGLIDSGVAEYCEFKSLLGLYLFMKDEKTSKKKKPKKGAVVVPDTKKEDNDPTFQLSRVPCSKRDVFQTKLLSPVEKRKLMKFLQIATDYAFAKTGTDGSVATEKNDMDDKNSNDNIETTSCEAITSNKSDESSQKVISSVEEEVVTSLNERQLQQGRSLYRPQNKSVSTSDIERLKECIHQGMDFDTYLESEHKLTPRLRDIVIYAMSLASNAGSGGNERNEEGSSATKSAVNYSTKDGMNDLSNHLQSLGRYGGTAFLVPLYGAGELSQAFCRSAAVHGGTYLLRRALKKVNFSGSSTSAMSGGTSCSSVTLEGCNDMSSPSDDTKPTSTKEIRTKHVVIPQDAIHSSSSAKTIHDATSSSSVTTTQKILRRISILKGKLLLDDTNNTEGFNSEQRHIIIMPPNTVGNKNVIHGIALDESANVAPYYNQQDGFTTTVLHLTTIIDQADTPNNDIDLLQEAVQALLQRVRRDDSTEKQSSNDALEEIYHISFSSEIFSGSLPFNSNQIPSGLHICNKFGPSVTLDSAFVEASSIFQTICPNSDFLKLSKAMDERVKESRFGLADDDENDMEKAVLESAMDIVSSTAVSDTE